jgi:hypothetical protein
MTTTTTLNFLVDDGGQLRHGVMWDLLIEIVQLGRIVDVLDLERRPQNIKLEGMLSSPFLYAPVTRREA